MRSVLNLGIGFACIQICKILTIYVLIRHAHFSHFSREREIILREISREKYGARNCEKKRPFFGQFLANLVPNLTQM